MCPMDQKNHEASELFKVFMKKGVGFFIVAVLTSFSISGVIEYLQVNFKYILLLTLILSFLDNITCKFMSSVLYIFMMIIRHFTGLGCVKKMKIKLF